MVRSSASSASPGVGVRSSGRACVKRWAALTTRHMSREIRSRTVPATRCHSKITDAKWPSAKDKWEADYYTLFRAATGRDHLWITTAEIASLTRGTMPESLTRRIALYHLIDNTRGEPPMWQDTELRAAKITATPEGDTLRLAGDMEAATANKDRTYHLKLLGYVETKGDTLVRFDLVARGQFRGHGQYTATSAPVGSFTLAIAFTLADQSNEAAKVAPQGFNADEYLAK